MPHPQDHALVNRDSETPLIRSSDLAFLSSIKAPNQEIYPRFVVEPKGTPLSEALTFDLIDHEAKAVYIVTPNTQMSDAQERMYRRINRANSYPALSDQIGAIIKQLSLILSDPNTTLRVHPEFQSIVDKIDAVKKSIEINP